MPTAFVCAVLFALCLCAGSAQAQAVNAGPPAKVTLQEFQSDFDFLWQSIHDNYAYLDAKTTDWDKVRDVYRPQLTGIQTRAQFISFLERVSEELYDPHISLNTNLASSPRLVPTGADIWAEWQTGKAIITEIRPASSAEKAGLRAGMEVLSVNGIPARQAVHLREGQCLRRPDPAADNWALRTLLAGRHNEVRRFVVQNGAKPPITVTLDDTEAERDDSGNNIPLLSEKNLPQDPCVGYIRFNNSLGQTSVIGQFDAALDKLKNTQGLMIDLRDTPSGGNTTVARGILGRFITQDMFYQKHDSPAEVRAYGIQQKWVDIVSPRRPFCYSHPVVVLVDHWTGSMGEGMAIGLDGMKRGLVVGTHMAGLNGAVESITLPNTGIGVNFPTERLFHINGTPREDFVPPVEVGVTGQDGPGHDAILNAGLKALEKKMQPSARNLSQ